MEVAPPLNTTNIHFTSSPYTNTPPSPPPTTGDQIFSSHDFDHRSNKSPATVPFAWEESPGVPKSTTASLPEEPIEFAFDLSGEFPLNSPLTADDLFHGGMIKPYAAVEEDDDDKNNNNNNNNNNLIHRGRETSSLNPPSSRNRRTRSLPPYRVVEPPPASETTAAPSSGSSCSTLLASGSGKGSKKWSFKDLFLFRSASDGRILDKDPLKKYSSVFRKHDEDLRNSSLRDRSGSGSGSKRRGPVSAHELHYTVNRAVSNDMKKKTFLPYKQGILGRLAFNPAVHALSNGFGFSHRNYN